jgi:hypothetical protein
MFVFIFYIFLQEKTKQKIQQIEQKIDLIEQRIKPKQFTRKFTPEQQQKLFDGLVAADLLSADTNKEHFMWVFGGDNYPEDFKQLKWRSTSSLLAYFVANLFAENNRLNIAESCFNKEDLSQAKYNYENNKNGNRANRINGGKPKGFEKIDTIIATILPPK